MVYAGMMPAVVAFMTATPLAWATAVVAPLAAPRRLVAAGMALHPHVALGVAYMVVLAVLVGATALRGLHGIGAFITVQAAYALVATPPVPIRSAALMVLAGGVWAAVVTSALLISCTHLLRDWGRVLTGAPSRPSRGPTCSPCS